MVKSLVAILNIISKASLEGASVQFILSNAGSDVWHTYSLLGLLVKDGLVTQQFDEFGNCTYLLSPMGASILDQFAPREAQNS